MVFVSVKKAEHQCLAVDVPRLTATAGIFLNLRYRDSHPQIRIAPRWSIEQWTDQFYLRAELFVHQEASSTVIFVREGLRPVLSAETPIGPWTLPGG
jgi:hypothetical protein